jgi:hypothetical protein
MEGLEVVVVVLEAHPLFLVGQVTPLQHLPRKATMEGVGLETHQPLARLAVVVVQI